VSISVIVIARNEAHQIERCIASCLTIGDVLVVDAFSTDSTADIARALGARVIQRAWTDFSDQKQFAVEHAMQDWILSVDADERVTPSLAEEIRNLDLSDSDTAFQLIRRNFFLGRRIRFSGWGNDCVIRLFNRRSCKFNGRIVHEKVEGYTKLQTLHGALEHYSYRTHHDVELKIARYAKASADDMHRRGIKAISGTMIYLKCVWTFLRVFVIQLGFLDGGRGLAIASMNARYTYLKYRLLKEATH
jgi:glycosyltransferase involved in cell wall biosynthesis